MNLLFLRVIPNSIFNSMVIGTLLAALILHYCRCYFVISTLMYGILLFLKTTNLLASQPKEKGPSVALFEFVDQDSPCFDTKIRGLTKSIDTAFQYAQILMFGRSFEIKDESTHHF